MPKELIKSRFTKCINTYNSQAIIQKNIAKKLAHIATKHLPLQIDSALEIGCGTGFLTFEITKLFKITKLWINDFEEILSSNIKHFRFKINENTEIKLLPGDAELVDFPTHQQLIISASTLQWMSDLHSFFNKINTSLLPNGLFLFNTFGQNNFNEIKSLIDSGLKYKSAEELRRLLCSNFEIIESFEETHTQTFENPRQVLRHLQQTGVTATNQHFIWNKNKLQTFEREYSLRFTLNNEVTLTWHVIYFICKKK